MAGSKSSFNNEEFYIVLQAVNTCAILIATGTSIFKSQGSNLHQWTKERVKEPCANNSLSVRFLINIKGTKQGSCIK